MLYEERQKWLDNLNLDDRVAVTHGYNHEWYYGKVVKITPKRWITVRVKSGQEYTFKNEGKIRSKDRWTGGIQIDPLTDEMINERRRKNYIYEIKNFKFDNLTLKQADEILNLLEKYQPKKVDEQTPA